MTRHRTLQSFAVLGLALTASTAGAQVAPGTAPPPATIPAQPAPGQVAPGQVAPRQVVPGQPGAAIRPGQPAARPIAGQAAPARAGQHQEIDLPGPIDSLQDVQDSLRMAFMMADQDHDGQLSQREVTDAANMAVGGLFFAADANGDGSLSREEAQQVRERIGRQYPALRVALQRAKAEKAQDGDQAASNPARAVANLLDADNDQQIKASELRQGVETIVQGGFQAIDTNRDNQLSPNELNAAAYGLARAGLQAAFQTADADRNGNLSRDEFDKALVEPGHTVFAMLDVNQDEQLSQEELNRAGEVIASRLQMFRVPRGSNSIDRVIDRATTAGPDAQPAQATPRQP